MCNIPVCSQQKIFIGYHVLIYFISFAFERVGRKNPQNLTKFSPGFHPRHLMGKRTAQNKIPPKTSPATARLFVGWLVWVFRPFETVFQSISGVSQREGERERGENG